MGFGLRAWGFRVWGLMVGPLGWRVTGVPHLGPTPHFLLFAQAYGLACYFRV